MRICYQIAFLVLSACLPLSLTGGVVCADSPCPDHFGHSFSELKGKFNVTASDPQFGKEILLTEIRLKYNENGACEETRREVWISRLKSTGDQGTLEMAYSPWYQNKPSIKARVFDRNGKMYELTEEDSTVAAEQGDDRTVLTDKLIVRSVLPGLQENGIVEQITTMSERAPFFRSGSLKSMVLDAFVPTQYLSIEIEAPIELALNVGFAGTAAPIRETTSEGKRRWQLELSPPKLIDVESIERSSPIELAQISSLVVSTGTSWKELAKEYSDLVDQRLSGFDFASLVRELNLATGLSRRQQVDECKKWLQNNIRYTSISFGDASIVPTRPMQLLARRFGDCKDQSTLLVGLLRELGIDANVALVNSWSYRMPNSAFPALNGFDHAIVHAKVDGSEFWIDCTFLGSGPESVPIHLLGKKSLIASVLSEQLSKIPLGSHDQNSFSEVKNITIEGLQYGTQSDELHKGYFAASMKNYYMSVDKSESESQVNKQLSQSEPNAKFSILSLDDPWQDTPSFRRSISTTGIGLTSVNGSKLRLDITFSKLFEELPEAYLMRSESNAKIERKNPAELIIPFSRERKTIIASAKGQILSCKVGEQKETIGCVSLLRRTTQESPEKIIIEMKLEADSGTLTVPQLEKLSDIAMQLDDLSSPWNAFVFTNIPDAIQEAITVSSIQERKEKWEQDPTGETLEKYIEGLIGCAMVDEARRIAEDATKKYPTNAWSHTALGWTWVVDALGREFYPGMNQPKAVAAFRRALEVDPDHMRSAHFLSFCLIRDQSGLINNDKELRLQCIDLVENAIKNDGASADMISNLINCYIRNGQYEEAIEQFKKQGQDGQALGLRFFEDAMNGRWKDIEEKFEKRQPNLETLEPAMDFARRCLSDMRKYKDAARLMNLLAKAGVKDAATTSKLLSRIQVTDVPENPTASPLNVANELLVRIASDGIFPEQWGDILVNPEEYNNDFEFLASILFSNRESMRQTGISRQRVLDLPIVQIRVSGNEENGFVCTIQFGNRSPSIAVLKTNGEFKILLSGKNMERLIAHARDCASRGKYDDAYKWMDFLMQSFPDAIPLSAETGAPAKAIWKSVKSRSPEIFDRCTKMLASNSPAELSLKQFEEWSSKEKSASKKMLYHRWMLDQLATNSPADYLREVTPFLEKNPTFYNEMYRAFFTQMNQGEFEKGQEFAEKWKSTMPEELAALVDSKLYLYQDDYDSALPRLLASSKLFNLPKLWNSYFWAALFAGRVDGNELKPVQELLRNKGSLADLHTLACAEAEAGMLEEAVSDLKLLNALQGNRMDNTDWVIVGLIAQKCQHYDAAKMAYARVKPHEERFSSYELAQKRLKSLDEGK